MSRIFFLSAPRRGGFTLVELLLVIAIGAALLALAVPAFTDISRGIALTRAGQELSDMLVLGRQEALARNRKAMIRLIKLDGEAGGENRYRAIQTWMVKDDDGATAPLTGVITFPTGIVLAETPGLSPLLQSPPASTGTMTVHGSQCSYASFAILANGSLESSISNQSSFLTLVQERDANLTVPTTFFSVFINPVTGEVSSFRP